MLDVCLLGSGGMMPLPYRWLTALMTRYNGSQLLIDCGEGTQIALKEKGCNLFHTLPWRSYQRASGTSSYNGKCGQKGTAYSDWTERSGESGEFFASDRAGTAI